MARSKKERVTDEIAELVGAGKPWTFDSVDFSNPNRPKTCLEVDFPIVPINEIAQIEGNAGKPIYQMSKWWARRRSSVFRSMLLAAATKAPDDESESAAKIWKAYYGNHQNNPAFKALQVGDLFMGGGTTLVEGSRLGMKLFGCDLNPVAWFVVKNEVTPVDVDEVKRLFAEIEADVKPYVMPYFTCDGPEGEKGVWFKRNGGAKDGWEKLSPDFDIWTVPWQDRPQYRYEGPEIIYTFWAKHGPCEAQGCGHRTPLMTTPVVAIKTLVVKHWPDYECACGKIFDVEQFPARMSPAASLAVAPSEKPFASMNARGEFKCPHCGKVHTDLAGRIKGDSVSLGGKAANKKIELSLLMHPSWLKGCGPGDDAGNPLGGSATDDVDSSVRWIRERAKTLRLVEVRGSLPETVTCPATGVAFSTGTAGGNVPKRSTFDCQAPTCGRQQDVLESIKKTKKTGPKSPYVIQAYSPKRDAAGFPYGGRYFASASETTRYEAALREWNERAETDLAPFWPRSELPFGFMTHMNNGGIPNHGYTHWWKMFNPLQLLVHSQLLKCILSRKSYSEAANEAALGAFQQYLRNQNQFTIWNTGADKLEPMFANNNFHPKATAVENNVFNKLGRGNWESSSSGIVEGVVWANAPSELVAKGFIEREAADAAASITGKSKALLLGDKLQPNTQVLCQSSTELKQFESSTVDLVVTDPPFGGLLHYSELSDFFYVWLRLALKDRYPDYFTLDHTPKALEAVANKARQSDPDSFYREILTKCWREAHRILKPGGLLTFTFHHSEDEPWVDVLESLFNAGFYLEATYPIRSDETKGEGAKPGTFGSQTIEYDIIHVCRKRQTDPTRVSWARLRRRIMDDVRQLKALLEQHHNAGLPEADLRVIKRGKALEYYSQHYGKVFVEQGREFTLKEALVGINQLIDDEDEKAIDAPPITAEAFSRQFIRIFRKTDEVPNDQLQKTLRGTGMSAADFEHRGWCEKDGKVYRMVEPLTWARAWKGQNRKGMARDLDQTLFLIGASYTDSGINVWDTLNSANFLHHPAIPDLLLWFGKNGANQTVNESAYRAQRIYADWMERNKASVQAVQAEFGFVEVT
jgi:putative DNA methylase